MDAQRIGGMIGWVGKCMDEWKCVQTSGRFCNDTAHQMQ